MYVCKFRFSFELFFLKVMDVMLVFRPQLFYLKTRFFLFRYQLKGVLASKIEI